MKQYFWSYNMLEHWRRAHPQQPMPAELRTSIEPSPSELALLNTLKEAKLSKRKREAREQHLREHEADAAKRARIAEREAAEPLGRGHRRAPGREPAAASDLLAECES